jgi:hypothetical protein
MNKPKWILLSAFGVLAGVSQMSAAETAAPAVGPALTAEEGKVHEQLTQRGVLVQPLAAGLNWFYVNFRGADKPDASLFGLLKGAPGTVELDLSGQKVTDSDLAALSGLVNLRKLNLSKSAVSDAGLAPLQGLGKLESLNLFQTEVSDGGLANLKGCQGLKRLYVFQTKVTDAGVEKLKAALPGLKVERGGVVLTPPKKDEPKKDEPKKDEPKKDEPKKDEPKKDEPKKDEPAKAEASAEKKGA